MCICHILTCTTCIDETIKEQDEAIRQKDAYISRLMKRRHLPAMDTPVAKAKSTEKHLLILAVI